MINGASTDTAFEIDADLPQAVVDAYAVVAEANLSPDHAFLLGYTLLGQYLAHHVEQVTDLTDELMAPDMHSELTEQERFDRLGWLAVWAADQGRLEGALDLLLPVVQGANDHEDGDSEEEGPDA